MDQVVIPKVVQVVVPRPLPEPLSYLIPDALKDSIKPGMLVEVPFRSQAIFGMVIELKDYVPTETYKLKEVGKLLFEGPLFTDKDIKFFSWISNYYQLPLGEVLHSALPKAIINIPSKKKATKEKKYAPASLVRLTDEQELAVKKIENAIESLAFKSFLLFGVTGSGKTEVYIHAARKALTQNRGALILVPEIALTPQLRNRFESHFGDEVAVLHSSLGEKRRREYWWDILNGKRKVVVGARSALFAPLKDIGLIVVDEEHEATYKQEDRLRYSARDLALVRASQHGAVALLGSATPSIETFHAAINGKHELLVLTKRPQETALPSVEIIDLRENSKDAPNFLSQKLLEGIAETITNKEQAIIFVNRKGFSNFLLCESCGHVPDCFNCSVSLTYYKSSGELKCHYCGLKLPIPVACDKCSATNLKYMGVGTERIQEELQKIFSHATIARLDADVANTINKLESVLEDFRGGKSQILVGTQMIAKGHDFPNVTFVGVVLADTTLRFPDFRSGERTFQLLAQVAGRAGRDKKQGRVVIQTFVPEHYVIQSAAKQDYRMFYEQEIIQRKECAYPPFARMAQVEFRDLKEERAKKQAMEASYMLELLKQDGVFEYLGPAPATIEKVANQYRWKILLKSEKSSTLNAVIKTLRKQGVRFIDVDPVSTL